VAKSVPSLGFLSIIDRPEAGLLGGYLIVNANGRPLEFHCTAPVKANRAQQILYGPTLAPYLYGEQIGRTLITTAKASPLFVCTDQLDAMSAGEQVDCPVVLLSQSDAPQASGNQLHAFELDGRQAAAANGEEQRKVLEAWRPYLGQIDLAEPFARIKDALEEAHKGKAA